MALSSLSVDALLHKMETPHANDVAALLVEELTRRLEAQDCLNLSTCTTQEIMVRMSKPSVAPVYEHLERELRRRINYAGPVSHVAMTCLEFKLAPEVAVALLLEHNKDIEGVYAAVRRDRRRKRASEKQAEPASKKWKPEDVGC